MIFFFQAEDGIRDYKVTGVQTCALPISYETFGLVVAQAMSYGRAVVSVRSTALPEVVGDAGVLVPPGDPIALGDAIAALAHDPARRRALGEAGRRRAAALYAWDRVAEGYERVLARAAARGKARRAG